TVFSQSKLPFQLAGTTPLHIRNSWRMFSYRITWPTTRFYFDDFIDWLYLPATQACYDLDASKLSRIKDLLQQAGFKRGFDHEHLQETPSAKDQDFRFSFQYAVDRLAMGLAVPLTTLCPTEFGTQSQHDKQHGIISFNHISRDDTLLIQILLRIASDFKQRRTWLNDNEKTVIEWLAILIKDIDQLRENNKVAHLEQVRNIVKKYDTMLSMSEYDKDKKEKTESVLAQLKIPLLDLVQDIQQQLENQVEQASITGAITFSQIGQIRPLPYQLIVLLNLDQGVFPQRDHPLAFDLMHILPSKIGDRSRLEDHKGAFLDAILQAQQNLWLFYTGFDADSHEVLEPSSIVQEFLQHLAHLLDQTDTADHATINAQGLEIYQALERLYYIHPAEPFVPQGFQQTRIPRYENEWFQIAKQLQHGTQQQQIAQSWFDVTEQAPAHHEPTAQQFLTLDAETWIKDLRFPARILLKQLKINNQKSYSEHDLFEPLIPNHLDQFKILAQLLPAIYDNDFDEKNTSYQLDTELPVGKMKMVVKAQQEQWVAKFQQRLDDLQLQITATSNVSWQVPTDIAQGLYGEHIVLQMQLPHKDVQQWCQIQGSNSSAKYRLAAWLRHILWLSALNLGDQGHDYTSYLVLKDVTLCHTGISSNEAKTYLTEWFEAYHYAQKQPLVLPVELVIKHALKDYKDEDFDFEKSLSLATTEWFNTYAKFKNNEENENRLTHLDWQFLLQDLDSEHLLRQSLDQFIQLYCTLLDHEQQVN
ncbi:MAG: exodeoxyribonuclease V subunit gamma, partial [Acinetobacter sp.]|nr:exodeoxyribonuclease V subunit gamma [Acinetobacter sp.]